MGMHTNLDANLNTMDLGDPISFAVNARDSATLDVVQMALRTKNVMLAYQPIMRAGDQSRPAFFEGLIRVMDPTGRVIPAREFIGAVENHEMGRVLDCLALEMGLIALQNTPGLRLSINMSARSIGYRRWMETLEAGLRGNPTVAERLILEITESSCIVMPDVVQAFMADLQLRGICFAMDDFGSGYTAFKYFRDFDFDMLKIDGSFIRGIDRNPDNQVLVQALVGIARHFDMFTVAEFVETAQEAEFLTSIGVDCLQGYHFGAPELRPEWQTRQTSRLVS